MATAQRDERGLTYTARIGQCQTCGTLEEYWLYRGDMFRQYWYQVCDGACQKPTTYRDLCEKTAMQSATSPDFDNSCQ